MMRQLSILYFLVAISTCAFATSVKDFYGKWTIVKAFKEVAITDAGIYRCTNFLFRPGTNNTCYCSGDALTSFSVDVGTITSVTIYGLIKDTHQEAINFAQKSCKDACGKEFIVLRKIDNNYIMTYFNADMNEVPDLALFAKSVPSFRELDTLVRNIKGFENKFNKTLCTSDLEEL